MITFASLAVCANAQRSESTLNEGWQFSNGTLADAQKWQNVRVPHDWAIYGPFDRANDLQKVAVKQNGEKQETVKTGRTGGLPLSGRVFTRQISKLQIPPVATSRYCLTVQ